MNLKEGVEPNWDKVVSYLSTNKLPPNYTSKVDISNNDDGSTYMVRVYDPQGKVISFWYHGSVSANKIAGGSMMSLGKWTWDGTKPVIPSIDNINPTKSAAGYAKNEDDIIKNNKILGVGSRNDLVKKIQDNLYWYYEEKIKRNELPNPGCSVGADEMTAICDGIFGQKTKQVVLKYQEDLGLNKDGYVGNETYRNMFPVSEMHKSNGYKKPINEQLTQNQRQASLQSGPVSRERADQLAADGKLNVDTANNPIFDCVKNYLADFELQLRANDKNKIKIKYFPDYMAVVIPPGFYSGEMENIEKFFTDGRYEYYVGDKLMDSADKWYCRGARFYDTRNNATPATLGAKEPEKKEVKQELAPTNCAASLSEIKAGSNKILKKGCKTDAVKELQKMLKMEEKNHTGLFGDITKAKVIEFQKNNKDAEGKSLVPDGIVGDKTYEALVKANTTTEPTSNLKGATSAVQQYLPKGVSRTLN